MTERIPVDHATVLWRENSRGKITDLKVIDHRDRRGAEDNRHLDNSNGAVMAGWPNGGRENPDWLWSWLLGEGFESEGFRNAAAYEFMKMDRSSDTREAARSQPKRIVR